MNNVNSTSQSLPTVKTSGLAIASLILGICGIFTCGLTAIIGLILGIVGLCAISKRAPQLKGQGLAIAGTIISAIFIVLMPIMAIFMALLIPSFDTARSQAKKIISMNNAKQLCLAMAMYCEENEGSLPPVDNWPDVLKPYLGNEQILTSPFAPEAGRAWAMNIHLEGHKIKDIKQPARTVLIFESRLNGPPAGGLELLPEVTQERKYYIIGFVDGHIESLTPERLDELIWAPDLQPYLEVK
ncbi:MAG: DUF4190 domain-containing protein [Planctomycetota bacterium]|jgi:hypothetical protein